jgi:hypothetical protein
MNRILVCAIASLIAGCQHPAWQNPYAMIGPATVPPPAAASDSVDYYPAAADRTGANSAGGTIRSEISSVAPATSDRSPPSFAAAASTAEPPIRIVEATPAKPKTTTTPVKASPAPLREPSPNVPQSAVRRDASVIPAGYSAIATPFVEKTATAAQGQWRVR